MEEPRYILLWRNPFDDISLIGTLLEPLTEEEADRQMLRYFSNSRDAGREPEPILKWQVVGEPVEHGAEFLDGVRK